MVGQSHREHITCEGYGPGGAAVLVDCCGTDRERTIDGLREVFRNHGGQLGASGSVAYLFTPVGRLAYRAGTPQQPLATVSIQSGAEDLVVNGDGSIEVLTDPRDLDAVRAALAEAGMPPALCELTRRPVATLQISAAEGRQLQALVDALNGLDEVNSVWINAATAGELRS